jgi:Protein of unknown function (DUF551)
MENWISVKREVPPNNEDVILTHLYWRKGSNRFFSLYMMIGKRTADTYFDSNTGKNIHEIYKNQLVTHWTEVPPLPFL